MGNNSYSNDTKSLHDEVFNTIIIVYRIIFCVIGLLGNGLVMYIIIRYPKLRNAPNLYILNLSLAQFFYYVREVVMVAYMFIGPWTFGVAVCKIYRFVWAASVFAGSGFLAILSVERHQAVVNPVLYWADRLIHERRVAFRNACVLWGVVAILCVPHIVFADVLPEPLGCYFDTVGSLDADTFNTIRIFYTIGLGFVVPLMIMIPCYVFLIIRLRQVKAESQGGSVNPLGRVSRLVVVLVTVFISSNLPGYVVSVVKRAFDGSVELSEYAEFFIYALQDISPCFNPVLCVIMSGNFRSAILKTLYSCPLCPRKWRRHSRAVASENCRSRSHLAVQETTLPSGQSKLPGISYETVL